MEAFLDAHNFSDEDMEIVWGCREPVTWRNNRRFFTYIVTCCQKLNLNMVEATTEKVCGDILNKALVYGNNQMHYPVSAISGMKACGTWLIDIAFHPSKFAEEIVKAVKKQHPKAPATIPDTDIDVTSLFQRLDRSGWIANNTGGMVERALVFCFVHGGVRFAELARMTWENVTFSQDKIEFILKVKNSEALARITYHRLRNCVICPVQAINDVKQAEEAKHADKHELCTGAIWTTDALRPMNADQIGTAVATALKKMGLPEKRPYRLKHLVADHLMRSTTLHHVDVANFYRHNPASYMVERAYAQNDAGKRVALTLAGVLQASSTSPV
jgi:site-specific recombinase XerC